MSDGAGSDGAGSDGARSDGARSDGAADDAVVRALQRLAAGRPDEASAALDAGGGRGGRLRRELAGYLAAHRRGGGVYDDPAAFQAFVAGGGNVRLYRAVTARLAAAYRDLDAGAVLDVGCGDGRVVVPAATGLAGRAPELDLVEPSTTLLAQAATAARAAGLVARTHPGTVQEFLARGPGRRWAIAQATFALHAIPPGERTAVLAGLAGVADSILVVEFDVPAFDDRGPAHLRYLAERYEAGVAEYDGSLVTQGFLMPVLAGQVDPASPRLTWEQPAAAWVGQLREAGWRRVTAEPLVDYWWAPAAVITGWAGAAG